MIKKSQPNLKRINQSQAIISDSIKSARLQSRVESNQRSLIPLSIIKIGEAYLPHSLRDNSKESIKSSGSVTFRTSQYNLKKSASQSRVKTQLDLQPSAVTFRKKTEQSQESTTSTIHTLKKLGKQSLTFTNRSSSIMNSPQQIVSKKISPPKLSQFGREKTSILIPKRNHSQEQISTSPSKLSSNKLGGRRESDLSPIRSKQESISSMITGSEDHSVWDNKDLIYRGIFVHNLPEKDELQHFLKVFKMRFGGFPGQQQTISNEDVIKFAVTYAKVNKKMFRKYFPSNQVIFEDDVDYSKEHDLTKDENYSRFVEFFNRLKDNSLNRDELKRQYKDIMEQYPKQLYRRASTKRLSKEESPLVVRQREVTQY